MTRATCSTLVELLCWWAARQPGRRAYTFLVDGEREEVHVTYAELDRRARAIGAWLQGIGAAGERVLLLYPSGLEYIVSFFGCMYAGAVAVPSYPPRLNRSDPRIEAMVVDSQAKVAFTTANILSSIERRSTHLPQLQGLQWSTVDDIDDSLAAQWRPSAIRGDTLVFLQYTSGSTAKPKGVMVNHSNLVYNLHMLEAAFDLTDQTSIVSWLPLFHDMGLIGNVFNTLNVGTTCVLMEPTAFLYKPIRWLQAISRHRAYFSGAPNFAYDLCARKVTPEQREALDLNSWQAAFNGAEPVRHATLERFVSAFEPCGFRRQVFRPCYGLAEATLFVSSGPMATRPVYHDFEKKALEQDRAAPASGADDAAVTLVGCGQTWLDQKIVIVDPENLTRLPPGSIGEIWLSGPNVAQGYWNKPEETERTFGAYLADTGEGPFLRTGDLGFLQDGELFITGRVKDLIIIGGRNLYPQDIELLVEQSHPALRPGCSAAFSVDLDDGERLVIAVEVHRSYRASSRQEGAGITSTPDGNGGLDTKAVFKTIQQAVAEQHEVRVHDLVLLKHGGIPKTSSGKIQRHACKAGYLNGDLCMWGD